MPELVLKDSEFHKLSKFVQGMAGINLHEGKRELVKARLGRILRQRDFQNFGEYYDYLVNDKGGYELTVLLNSISTNLTYFFREPQHFEFLAKGALPGILKNKEASRDCSLKFWSAGCSSGEETYSLAIAVIESLNDRERWHINILGTDLSTKVLEIANAGIYEERGIAAIPYELKKKYFQMGANRWKGYIRVKPEFRKMIHFKRLNFMEDFHFAEPFDVIFCRNVMIYFDKQTREMLVGKFIHNLAHGGYFFIGHSESLIGIKHNLKYIQPSVYRKM